jgi:hypothetical protein
VTYRIKQHDLEPPLIIDVTGSAGDLDGVESWKVIGKLGDDVVFTDTAPEVEVTASKTGAAVTHKWADGETDTAGLLHVEIEATWPGGRPQTFPPAGTVAVRIEPDLG